VSIANARPSFHCTRCGAVLDVPEGEVFFICPYCASALYLDRSRVVFHYALVSTLSAETAERTLRRWMGGNEMARNLDHKAEIDRSALRYVPLWYFRVQEGDEEKVYVEPAAATTVGLLRQLTIPPGELHFYDAQAAPNAVRPSVPYPVALERLRRGETSVQQVREAALVHVPLYVFRYRYRGKTYVAAVDGSSGQVLSDAYPSRWELPYRAVAVVTFAVFFLEAFIAYLVMPWVGDELGLALGLRCCVQLWTGVPLFLLAWLVARKA
jgi:hypothetical protein